MEDLHFFVAVAQERSFTRAAQLLGCTRSYVSKRVCRLERDLGVRLLQRTTRQVTATPVGQELLERAGPLLTALAAVRADIATHRELLSGRVRIAVPLSYGLVTVAPVLHEFAELHAQVELDVEYLDAKVDLVKGGFDLAIRGGDLRDSSLIAQRLSSIEAGLWAHPSYLELNGRPEHPSDMVSHQMILTSGDRIVLELDGERAICRGSVRVRSNNADARAHAAMMSLGVALLPNFVVHSLLVRVLPGWHMPGDPAFWLIRPPGRSTRRLVDELARHLVERLS